MPSRIIVIASWSRNTSLTSKIFQYFSKAARFVRLFIFTIVHHVKSISVFTGNERSQIVPGIGQVEAFVDEGEIGNHIAFTRITEDGPVQEGRIANINPA